MDIDTWKDMMIGGSKNTPKVISQLIESLKSIGDDDYLNQVIMLSARQKDLKKSLMMKEITEEMADSHQIKINRAVLYTLDEMDDDDVFSSDQQKELVKIFEPKLDPSENNSVPTLDDLKSEAKNTQALLFSLQNEKQMTRPGKEEIILQRQIENTEQELEALKAQIQTLISEE